MKAASSALDIPRSIDRSFSRREPVSWQSDATSCWPELAAQEAREFEPFLPGISQGMIEDAQQTVEAAQKSAGWLRVVIIDSRIFHSNVTSDRWSTMSPRSSASRTIMRLLLKTMCTAPRALPDLDLVFNPSDAAVVDATSKAARTGQAPPVWSWAKEPSRHADIFFPYMYSADNILGIASARATDVHEGARVPWREKLQRLVWRGSTSGTALTHLAREDVGAAHFGAWRDATWRASGRWRHTSRAQLCLRCERLSADLAGACDVGFVQFTANVGNQTHAEVLQELGLKKFMNQSETSRHKYLAIVDGNGPPSSRSIRQFGTGNAAFWQQSAAAEFWYAALQPYTHYVPLDDGFADLENKLRWAKYNDASVRRIAESAESFMRHSMGAGQLSCYVEQKLRRYASLFAFRPSVQAAAARVPFAALQLSSEEAQGLRAYASAVRSAGGFADEEAHRKCLALIKTHTRR